MAKEYEKFKAEWDVVKKETQKALDDIKSNAQLVGQTTGIITHGTKEVGRRVQELKDQGQTGDEIKDFLADREVKQAMEGITDFMSSLEKELKRVEALHSGPWKKTKENYFKLKKELDAEIKTRKKAVSTKVGVGNKSLPLMEQLLKDINKYDNDYFTTFAVFVPEDIAQHRKELNFKLQDEIRKAKDVRLTEFQAMMQEQGLNTRHLKTNFGKAKTIFTAIGKALQDAEDAKRDRKPSELSAAQDEADKLFKQLVEIVDPYEKAPQDDWLRTQIQKSKDRSTIESGIKAFVEMKTKGSATLKKIKDLKIG
jgi:hypothetical protein